ncbi:MAG TPA: YceI family protein, partial [Gammaproteobacteria bacterium]
CQTAPRMPASSEAGSVPDLPDSPAYAVDPAASQLRVLVHRDGPLARFGHSHVVIAPVSGIVHAGEKSADSGFRLEVRVDDFDVDPAAARAEEGGEFAADVSAEAREGTRANLLGEKLLDAENHPRIVIESVSLSGPRWNPDVIARITLRGVARNVEFPAAVFEAGDTITVIANFTLVQSEFGIAPFSAFGGGLKVRDALDVRVKLVARRRGS